MYSIVHIYNFRNKYSDIHIIHITTGAKAGNPSVGRAAMSKRVFAQTYNNGCMYLCSGSRLLD